MKILIFGSENFPDISFKSNPKTGLTISTKNAETLNYDGLHEITWGDLIERGSNNYLKKTSTLEKREGVWNILKEKLLQYTQTKSEKYFFEGYIEVCEEALYESGRLPINKILGMPALIPQVWVNWLHYDYKDKERASLVKKIPQRVDFLMYFNDRWIIIEMDGSSHFSELLDITESGQLRLEGSMEKYTQHIRKDRWLRQQGYEVWRFSDLEIDEIERDVEFWSSSECLRSEREPGGIPYPNKAGYIYELFVNMGIDLPVTLASE